MAIPILMQSSYPVEIVDLCYYQNYTKTNVRQGINFAKVKASNRIRAVMVKASEGDWDGYLLSDFLEQAEGFHAVDLPVIPYHYWHYEVKPSDQARRFKSVINSLSFKPTRFMVDVEDCDNLTSNPPRTVVPASDYPMWTKRALLVAASVRDSLDAVAQSTGTAPLWYGADWYQGWWFWMAGSMGGMDMSWAKKYGLHCASYTAPWMYLPYGFDKALFWQWTSQPVLSKQIDGFPNPGSLDMNYFLGTVEEFDQWIGNKPSPPTPTTLEQRVKSLEDQMLLVRGTLNV